MTHTKANHIIETPHRVFTSAKYPGGDIIISGETVRAFHNSKLISTMTFTQMAKCGAVYTLKTYIQAINGLGFTEVI